MSTSPEVVTAVAPWKASLAVAPASLYVAPNSTVAGLSPFIVITGGMLSSYPSSDIELIAAAPTKPINTFCINESSTVKLLSL